MSSPRRILFVNLSLDWIGGQERVLLDMVRSLDRRRFEPVVWCNAPTVARAVEALGVVAHHSRFGYFFATDGGRFYPSRYLSYVRDALRLIRQERIDLVHCNGTSPLQFCVPAAFIARRPVIGHIHFDEDRRGRYVFLTHLATIALGCSHQTVQGLRDDGMDPRRIRVIHNGVDFARFSAADAPGEGLRERLGIAPGAPVIASAGALLPIKGPDVLLDAFARLLPANPEAHLLMAGKGPERDALEAQIARLGLGGKVHLLGFLEDPGPLYRAADIFVLPSRREAMPLVLIEAAMFGLPAVASSVGGIAEAVIQGETGLLVPPEDPMALAGGLAQLLGEPALRRRLGEQAKARAHAEFALPAAIARIEELYDELLTSPPRTTALGPYRRLLVGGRRGK